MYNRSYGTSGYQPTYHRREEPTPEPKKWTKPKLPGLNKAIKVLGLLIALCILIIWLLLGNFRFMMTKAPAFTGFPFGKRTYLVLFQNNYELRPTGGFISTYGELRFSHGIYSGIEFFDVYGEIQSHDRVEPPLILSALLEDENYTGHSFRDANFDPDFPQSKEDLIEFYHMTQPDQRIDGVIAADFHFLEQLVGLYEPINLDGYKLTEQNLFETLETAVSDIDRHNEEALAERKNITSPLVKTILKRSMLPPWRISRVLSLTSEALDEKHVLASFNRKSLEKAFAKRQWTGALPQSDIGDFLAINDSNYGGMKSNRYITRDVLYELEVSNAKDILGNPVIQATTTVTLSHQGIWNIPLSGLYTGYLRTMIPLGSKVETGSGITEEREDVEVLGEMVELEPGAKVSYTYTYELPEYVWQNGTYNLHLHKQPGTDADHYRVIARVPQGMSLSSSQFDVRENIGFFETQLNTDLNLAFTLLEDENPPRIVQHEITALNEITIVFNEAISPEFAGDPLLYQIVDNNFADANITDSLLIQNIRVDGAAVIITTSGMTEQSKERYTVTLRDIKDRSGNTITPSPRTITVVQNDDFTEPESTEPESTEPAIEEPTPNE